jgi:hypothetical protein
MKFTIEVEDFYMEEGDLESNLKQAIINDVTSKIRKELEKKIEDGVTKEVKAQVEQTLYRKISAYVSECIANDKVKGRYSNDPEITLQEWVKEQFVTSARDKSPVDETIKKLADNFGSEMKKRYDLLFASQLVAKLSGEGLLKEDAVKLLLDKN